MHQIRREVLFTSKRMSVEYDENHPDDRVENHFPLLLLEDQTTIGTARLDKRDRIGIVRLVAVREEFQGMGYGRKLDTLIEEFARKLGIDLLRVNAAPDAIGFYLKTGWQEQLWDKTELVHLAANAVQMQKHLNDR